MATIALTPIDDLSLIIAEAFHTFKEAIKNIAAAVQEFANAMKSVVKQYLSIFLSDDELEVFYLNRPDWDPDVAAQLLLPIPWYMYVRDRWYAWRQYQWF